jgi:hypothetical protein
LVVLISGEAGAGKSALVGAFLDRLRPDVTAVIGGCDDLLAPPSLGPFHDMAADNADLAAALSGDRVDDTMPALLHVFAARPSVVVVEDVHWADDATLDAFRYLARRIPGLAAALILTFRETGVDADHPLRQVLGSLAGSAVRRLTLSPLSVEAVRGLGAVSGSEAAEIHRVTQGNPFFVTEVLAAGGGSGVPATVRDAVLARLGRLPPRVRTLLQRLSVVPTRAERWLAETLAGDVAVVVEAERSGMIVGGTVSVSFRHELARQAIESSRHWRTAARQPGGRGHPPRAAGRGSCAVGPTTRSARARSPSSSSTVLPQPGRRRGWERTARPPRYCGSCWSTRTSSAHTRWPI